MKNEIKNYGFRLNTVEDLAAYKLGGIELPKYVLRIDGQWDAFLPREELQFTPKYDSFGCTIYGTENIQQTLEKFHNGQTQEYSERYNYNLVKIVPPGADPHDAAQSFKNDGVIPYDLLPITDTLEEYSKPRPVPNNLIAEGIAHPWELRHQWLWDIPTDKNTQRSLIQEYLRYSPLGVSVTAWSEKNGVYVDNGQRNTHWVMLYGWNKSGWLVFDSYAPHKKVLSYDHNMEVCKRYQLVASTRKQQISIMQQLLNALWSLLGLLKVEESNLPITPPNLPINQPPTPVLTQPEPLPEPPSPSVGDFAEAIKVYEGWQPPNAKYPNGTQAWRNKNPGNIRGKDGKFLVFSTEGKGFQYLCDYIKRVQRNEHPAYPKNCNLYQFFNVYAPAGDNNFPKTYAVWIAHRLSITPDFLVRNLV